MGMTIIKGYEIPHNCYDCDLHNYHECDLTSESIEEDYCWNGDSREKHCPLREVEAIPKADYENRLKADLVAVLTELQLEVQEMDSGCGWEGYRPTAQVLEVIQQKINDLAVSSGLGKNSKKLEKDFGESDCISRADALDCVNIGISFCDVYKKINDLPSVTPQEPMVIPIAEFKFDKDKLKELVDRAVLTVIPQEPTDKIFTKAELDSMAKAINYGWELRVNEVIDKIRAEIAEYGSIWVQYQITGKSDRDIEQLVIGVLKQAKEQVLEIIDKYKAEIEPQEDEE